jgi:uncharacterized protein
MVRYVRLLCLVVVGAIACTITYTSGLPMSTVNAASPAQGAITTDDFTITLGDGWQTKAKLSYPANQAGPFPTVILVHGSGPNDLDHTITPPGAARPVSTNFLAIGNYFAARGVAVLRFNKRYVSDPGQVDGEKFGKLNLADHVADLEAVFAFARQNPKVDAQQIFVYAWSEGTLTGTQFAVRTPSLAGLILMGALARTDRDYFISDYTDVVLPYVLSYSRDGKISSETLKAAQEGNGGLFAKGVLYDFIDSSATGDPKVSPFFDKNSDGLLDPETEIKPNLGAWVDSQMRPGGLLAFALQAPSVIQQASKLKVPVLILQGEHDAPARSTNVPFLNMAFAGYRDYQLIEYPGLGHGLGPVSSRLTDDFGPIEAKPMDDTLAWIKAHGNKPASLPGTGGNSLSVWIIAMLALTGIAIGGWLRMRLRWQK